jgi:hypothetical protein
MPLSMVEFIPLPLMLQTRSITRRVGQDLGEDLVPQVLDKAIAVLSICIVGRDVCT